MVDLIKAGADDARTVIEIKNAAFYEDYLKYGYCPGYGNTLEKMALSLNDDREKFIIVNNGENCGYCSVSGANGSYHLDCFCIVPEYKNQGIGQEALKKLLSNYNDAVKWTLETPSDKLRNHYFYGKFGFKIVSEFIDHETSISVFEKLNK